MANKYDTEQKQTASSKMQSVSKTGFSSVSKISKKNSEIFDVIIIGAGPAGLSAAIYAARYKLNIIVIGKEIGGYAAVAHKICNYPSYTAISGMELMQKVLNQVKELGVQILNEEVVKVKGKDGNFIVETVKNKYSAKKIIFSGGTTRQKLGVPDEEKYLGKGISYCATCDAGFFKNKIVAVVGGSDAALTSALLLSEYASKVYILYRGEKFTRADPTWIEQVKKNKKIEILFNEEVEKISGGKFIEGVKLKSGKELEVNGIFVEIGSVPEVEYVLSSLNVNLDKKGYIITSKDGHTNVKGFFAAGDITNNTLKQIITAAGEGATVAYEAYKEIRQ